MKMAPPKSSLKMKLMNSKIKDSQNNLSIYYI